LFGYDKYVDATVNLLNYGWINSNAVDPTIYGRGVILWSGFANDKKGPVLISSFVALS